MAQAIEALRKHEVAARGEEEGERLARQLGVVSQFRHFGQRQLDCRRIGLVEDPGVADLVAEQVAREARAPVRYGVHFGASFAMFVRMGERYPQSQMVAGDSAIRYRDASNSTRSDTDRRDSLPQD